jgi:hypothetical protein
MRRFDEMAKDPVQVRHLAQRIDADPKVVTRVVAALSEDNQLADQLIALLQRGELQDASGYVPRDRLITKLAETLPLGSIKQAETVLDQLISTKMVTQDVTAPQLLRYNRR